MVSSVFSHWKINFPFGKKALGRPSVATKAIFGTRQNILLDIDCDALWVSSWLLSNLIRVLRDPRRESNIWRPTPPSFIVEKRSHKKRAILNVHNGFYVYTSDNWPLLPLSVDLSIILFVLCFTRRSRGERSSWLSRDFTKHFNWIFPPLQTGNLLHVVFWNYKLVFNKSFLP